MPDNITPRCTQSHRQTVIGTVIQTNADTASIELSSPQRANCVQCQNKGGCQSLSLYQLIFAKRPLLIANQNYKPQQQLTIHFPDKLLNTAVYYLLGLPLAGFFIGIIGGWLLQTVFSVALGEVTGFFSGIVLAVWGYKKSKHLIQNKIKKQLHIKPTL